MVQEGDAGLGRAHASAVQANADIDMRLLGAPLNRALPLGLGCWSYGTGTVSDACLHDVAFLERGDDLHDDLAPVAPLRAAPAATDRGCMCVRGGVR